MLSFPRIVLFGINIAILVVAAYYIAYAHDVWEASSFNECLRVSETLVRWIGGITSAIAVVGIIGVCLKLKVLECFYLFALLLSTCVTLLLYLFVWAMLPRLTGIGVYEKTAEHGVWLAEYGVVSQKIVANRKDWSAAQACFRDIDTCRIMNNQTEDQKMAFIDIGCCIPPNRCGLEQASTGTWVVTPHGLNSTDDECQMWARVGRNCFECDSCRAAYLGNYHHQWNLTFSTRIKFIAFLIATTAIAYYIFMQDHYDGEKGFKSTV